MKKTLLIAMALCVVQAQGSENINPRESSPSKHKRGCSYDINARAKEISDAYNLNMGATEANPYEALSTTLKLDESGRLEVFTQCAEAGYSVQEALYWFIKNGACVIIQSSEYSSENEILFRLVEDLDPILRKLEHECRKKMRPSGHD